jgi:hypothetical protein
MQRVKGSKLFELTERSESANYAELKKYFAQIYFAN